MDDKPRNLKAMLAEAKDTSELMVDLSYAAIFFDDEAMAAAVVDLEEEMSDLVHDMRALALLAVRHPREVDGMSSVLQVVSAIERIANDAVDVARILTRRIGLPRQLVADLAQAAEVSHRLTVRSGSHLANRPLRDMELPVAVGMRVVAIRRGRRWITDIEGDTVVLPDDVLFMRGEPHGIVRLRELAAAPAWEPPLADDSFQTLTDLDRAVDTLIEMKNLSEAAVGLAYSALSLQDSSLAHEVMELDGRLDAMKESLELWVLRAAKETLDPSPLRSLLHLAEAAEDIGDQARQMVWIIAEQEDLHPVLALALGNADEVVVRLPVAAGSQADRLSLGNLDMGVEPGFHVLTIRRDNKYVHRPPRYTKLRAGDEVIAVGPEEGQEALARMLGWSLEQDEDTGELQLRPLVPAR
jgi:uncharacterized protein with PhoU and TrkA domain